MRSLIAVAFFLVVAQAADSGSAVAGHWKGQGHIVANWTTQHELVVDLLVTPEGAVSGTVGDAQVVSSRVESAFVVKVSLQGPILRGDGVVRKEFQLHLTPSAAGLTGFGASDGNKSWPGASRASRLQGAKVQVTRLVLEPSIEQGCGFQSLQRTLQGKGILSAEPEQPRNSFLSTGRTFITAAKS